MTEPLNIQPNLPDKRTAYFIAEFFKAMGDTTRVRIIALLVELTRAGAAYERRGLCVKEIAQLVGSSESAISHQLRGLRQMHLVHTHKIGHQVFYFLSHDSIADLYAIGLRAARFDSDNEYS